MAITIGLDFGTHQTKICIENSDSPLHKTYEFYEWDAGLYAFPSVIQINKDHTISYGIVDFNNCLVAKKRKSVQAHKYELPDKPSRPNIKRPRTVELPSEPSVLKIIDGKEVYIPITELYGIGKKYKEKEDFPEYIKWKTTCKDIENAYSSMLYNCGVLKDLVPGFAMEIPPKPILPEEPFLAGYDYNFCPELIATPSDFSVYNTWQAFYKRVADKNQAERQRYEKAMNDYNKALEIWQNECLTINRQRELHQKLLDESNECLPMIFRYFKQATFSTYKWDYEIQPQELTVLYLAYILFKLEDRFGTDFSIQMGVPASESNFKYLKGLASGYLIQAIRLVEDVFCNDYEKFLGTPYEELLSLIPKYEYSEELKMQYGLIVLPEAYAALRSLTTNSRIPRGMSIMLDMGGGTTDISFFVIEDDGEPHIYHFESIAKGLNFFLEYGDRHNFRTIDFTKKRELEEVPNDIFDKAYREFKGHIDTVIKNLTDFLHKDTISRGFMKSAFTNAVYNRPAIYTGGGCYDDRMRKSILFFTDVKYIDKNILGIPNVIDEKQVFIPYSLMATAYGLSIQRVDDVIEVSKKEDLFAKYTNEDDYDKRWDEHGEHGMYED